jgi:predicted enzyme related to lactoylglutathione lyase
VKHALGNVLSKLRLPGRQALRRWFREPRGGALAARTPSLTGDIMTATLALGPISQIARQVRDIEASSRWYAQVLSLPHLYTYGTLAFFDCGGTRLMLVQKEAPPAQSLLYFRVADIVQAHRELAVRGAEFIAAPHLIHTHGDGVEEWLTVFKDPDSQLLALHSQVKPRQERGLP